MAEQGCILSRYLDEQELACLRMERAANADTPHAMEWRKVAETLAGIRREHVGRCERCGGKA